MSTRAGHTRMNESFHRYNNSFHLSIKTSLTSPLITLMGEERKPFWHNTILAIINWREFLLGCASRIRDHRIRIDAAETSKSALRLGRHFSAVRRRQNGIQVTDFLVRDEHRLGPLSRLALLI